MKILNIPQNEYRAIESVSNSELQTIGRSPSDFIWAKNAPTDESKTSAFDFGTALHAALLEPETFNDSVLVYTNTKSRESVAFEKFYAEHKDEGKLILLESEYNKIRFQVDSAYAHPTFSAVLRNATHKECSILTELDGVKVKVRPDAIRYNEKEMVVYDVKSTASIDDWRSDAKWKNPLFTHGYGHTAAFYMDALEEASRLPVNNYTFLVVQKTVNMGRYPVAVIEITRDECERYGFFDDVYTNLATYKKCVEDDNWVHFESFPLFYVNDGELEIGFEGE